MKSLASHENRLQFSAVAFTYHDNYLLVLTTSTNTNDSWADDDQSCGKCRSRMFMREEISRGRREGEQDEEQQARSSKTVKESQRRLPRLLNRNIHNRGRRDARASPANWRAKKLSSFRSQEFKLPASWLGKKWRVFFSFLDKAYPCFFKMILWVLVRPKRRGVEE